MNFTQLLQQKTVGSGVGIYLKTSDGTEFRGTVAAVGEDFVQIETDQRRSYTVLVAHILFAALSPKE